MSARTEQKTQPTELDQLSFSLERDDPLPFGDFTLTLRSLRSGSIKRRRYATELLGSLAPVKVSQLASPLHPNRCLLLKGNPRCTPDLHMLPFTPRLREHFSSKELQDWADLMIERGLRIRIPFDTSWRCNSAYGLM